MASPLLWAMSLIAAAFAKATVDVNDVKDFQTFWSSQTQAGLSGAVLRNLSSSVSFPDRCEVAVVGAGWGGVYIAWRLVVDSGEYDPSDVCIFEANGRVGGRIYSLRSLPDESDLVIDVGGYRFLDQDLLITSLIQKSLKLPTGCYNFKCGPGCYGTDDFCYIIKDAYGNNAGFATAIETMLGQLRGAEGLQNQQVYFGAYLTDVENANDGSEDFKLTFASGGSVVAGKVILNLPSKSLQNLNAPVIDDEASRKAIWSLKRFVGLGQNKVYVYYEDAWWSTKLGLMDGPFDLDSETAPLAGRYHDGPQKCIIGTDPAGFPIFSGDRVPFGSCSGALLAYYSSAKEYYQKYQLSPANPLTVVSATGPHRKLIEDVHKNLMYVHGDQLRSKGFDPDFIPLPLYATITNWIPTAPTTPGYGSFLGGPRQRKQTRRPISDRNLFIVNVDWGDKIGWAEGSLKIAEKILSEMPFNLSAPEWLDQEYYKAKVEDVP